MLEITSSTSLAAWSASPRTRARPPWRSQQAPHEPAVDLNGDARDVRGAVGREEYDHVRELLGRADAAQRHFLRRRGQVFLHRLPHLRVTGQEPFGLDAAWA